MKQTLVFISSGKPSHYKKFIKSMENSGLDVYYIKLEWNHKTLTDWVNHTRSQLKKIKQPFHLVGFSIGAMVAVILAKEIKLSSLTLCSLSPFFKDIKISVPSYIKKMIGKKRQADFDNYNLKNIAGNIKISTSIFVGAKEIPIMIKGAEYTNKIIKGSVLYIEEGCKHDINCFEIKKGLPKETR